MDITLHVVLDAKTHSLSTPEQEAARSRVGDIVNVYSLVERSPNPNACLGFVHITGVPDVPLDRVRQVLLQRVMHTVVEPEARPQPIRKHQWRIPPALLPTAVRDELLNNREVTLPWTAVRGYVRKKIVVSPTDAAQDDETTELTTGDLS